MQPHAFCSKTENDIQTILKEMPRPNYNNAPAGRRGMARYRRLHVERLSKK